MTEEPMKASEIFEAALMLMDNNNTTSWYLDSGATKHVTRDPFKMFELKIVGDSNVCLVSGTSHSVLGKENVLFKHDRQVKKINNMEGKHKRSNIPKKCVNRTTQRNEIIHLDLRGPMPTKSLSCSRFFMTFTDDHSRKTWAYFLKVKSEAFQTFKDFRAMIENETSDGIKTIRKGRGGEFTSREKKTYCTNNGIIHVMVKP